MRLQVAGQSRANSRVSSAIDLVGELRDVGLLDQVGQLVGRDMRVDVKMRRDVFQQLQHRGHLALDEQVGVEDRGLVESVQRGIASGALDAGNLMPQSEKLIAHFQALVVDALA